MFPTEQAWMINPHKGKKGRASKMARRRRKSGRKGRMPAGLARYWAAKRGKANPKRRRRARRNQPFVVNSPRHRRRSRRNPVHRRRHYRRNPGIGTFLPSTGFLKEVAFVAGGYYGTKISAGFVLPMIGISGDIPRLAVKSVVAFGVSYLGGMLLGQRVKESLLMGGALEVAQDAIKTYLSPFVPALAAAEMESYYLPGASVPSTVDQTMRSYYQVGELPSDNYSG